jgi:hypothetical protein
MRRAAWLDQRGGTQEAVANDAGLRCSVRNSVFRSIREHSMCWYRFPCRPMVEVESS